MAAIREDSVNIAPVDPAAARDDVNNCPDPGLGGRSAPVSGYKITPELVAMAYMRGIFPMAESREDGALYWIDPDTRCLLPIEGIRLSRSMRRRLRRAGFAFSTDRAFGEVIRGCADRPETWISHRIEALFAALHRRGLAHSVEVWLEGRLVGGLYGLALGGAFFGESMFSRVPDASKAALAWLLPRLRRAGFTLFDAQFMNPHLARLGAFELPRAAFRARLAEALARSPDWSRVAAPEPEPWAGPGAQPTDHSEAGAESASAGRPVQPRSQTS